MGVKASESVVLVTAEGMAKILGVPTSWVYRMTANDKIPHAHVGRYVRFDKREVLEWVRQGSRQA